MSRLYDRLLVSDGLHDWTRRSFRKNPPVVVSVDNVTDYSMHNPSLEWFQQPFYKSPFDYIFIETERPSDSVDLPYSWGMGCAWRSTITHFSSDPDTPGLDGNWFPMLFTLWVQETISSPIHKEWEYWFDIDGDGNLIDNAYASECWNKNGLQYSFRGYDEKMSAFHGRPIHNTFLKPSGILRSNTLARPLFFALTLINCKNVELQERHPLAFEKQKHYRKHREPMVSYRVVKVNPMRTVQHYLDGSEQPSGDPAGNMPLHITRGHFKDYRDGNGLFGNPTMKGVYWWDQHVRGSIENGVVVKDYEVQAPPDAPKSERA